MPGFDTYAEWFALVGAIFIVWLLVVALLAPHIPYKLHIRLDCSSKQFIYSLHNATLSAVLTTAVSRLTKDFLVDLESSEEVTLETWKRRPLFEKIVEPFAWILERQQ